MAVKTAVNLASRSRIRKRKRRPASSSSMTQPAQGDRLEMEHVAGEDRVELEPAETVPRLDLHAEARDRSPLRAGWPRLSRRRSGSRVRRARRGSVGTPRRILGGQADDQRPQAAGDGGSTSPGRCRSPAAGDESPVPAHDRSRCDEHAEASARRKQPGQGGDQGSVGPADPRSGSAPVEHSELVTQDADLDLLGVSDRVCSTIQLRSLDNRR
jgi:hypothetical protein